jgi:hypothetical protein
MVITDERPLQKSREFRRRLQWRVGCRPFGLQGVARAERSAAQCYHEPSGRRDKIRG